MNYETPSSRFGAIGVEVIPRGEDIEVNPYEHMLFEAGSDDLAADRETFFPSSAVELSPDAYDQDTLIEGIHAAAKHDVESGRVATYLHPEAVVERALEVYDVYASDTSYGPEAAVAEYLYAFTEAVLDPSMQDISTGEIEEMFHGISELLRDIDQRLEQTEA